MEKLKFTVAIKASKSKVWSTLWNDVSYRKWTRAFSESSYFVGNWEEGSEISFLDDKNSGMYSTIQKNVPGELMVVKHLGIVKNGEKQPPDEETKKWGDALETYILKGA